jgi:hypothetical protein
MNLKAPTSVRSQLHQGLELWRRGLGGDGLRQETIDWARRLTSGQDITLEKARKMAAWFARHGASPLEVAARKRQALQLQNGTLRGRAPALVAWLLWGGDPAVDWSQRVVALLERPRPNPERLERCVKKVTERLQANLLSPGETRSRAWAICTATLQRSGYLAPGTRTITAAGKAADRRQKRRA